MRGQRPKKDGGGHGGRSASMVAAVHPGVFRFDCVYVVLNLVKLWPETQKVHFFMTQARKRSANR